MAPYMGYNSTWSVTYVNGNGPGGMNAAAGGSSSKRKPRARFAGMWGHIALFYLTEQMHRWKRFIFRFDRRFESMKELKIVAGACSVPLIGASER